MTFILICISSGIIIELLLLTVIEPSWRSEQNVCSQSFVAPQQIEETFVSIWNEWADENVN